MPDLHHLVLFIAAGLLLNLTPGPDVMFIVAQSVRGGVRAGVTAALGIAAGCCVHVVAAALGVSAVLAASSTAFAALKWLGAVYLVWVGVQMLRSAWNPDALTAAVAAAPQSGEHGVVHSKPDFIAIFRRGFLTNVLNPKVALFFLAFVPQFIAPGTLHPAGAFLALGLLFTVNGALVCFGWALAASWAARRAGSLQRWLRALDGLAGGVFVAFGIRLALTDAPAAR